MHLKNKYQLRKRLKTKQIVIKRMSTKSSKWKNLKSNEIKKNLILWIISNKTDNNKKNRDRI
jgi:hypothetical protein